MDSEVFLLLCLFVSQSFALQFEVADRDEITTQDITGNRYYISMHEEIAAPFALGTFDADSVTVPTAFILGPPSNLGLYFDEATRELRINIKQDYEDSIFVTDYPDRRYAFTITAGSEFVEIFLTITNVNDNSPLIQAQSASCQIEENTGGLGVSDCVYIITDLDEVYDFTASLSGNGYELFKQPTLERGDNMVTLEVITELDYETITLHVMELAVTDKPIAEGDTRVNTGTARVVVEVIDVADQPPMWTNIFASREFDELEPQTFEVSARDGDLGIDDDITYRIENNPLGDDVTIDALTGEIKVSAIDRDARQEQTFTFNIIACEVNLPGECITQSVVFLITDLNNQIPEITVSPQVIEIDENFYGDLDITISVTDLDLGENAMYDISLASTTTGGVQHSDAFTVAPSTGYQSTNVYMFVINYELLDYEEVDWREFTITINTADFTLPFNTDSREITIRLNNLNDEIPIFQGMETDGYVAYVDETIAIDELVLEVLATDRDEGDAVSYALLGTYINSILSIDENGIITTKRNGAFDYESQEEVILQVRATDSLAAPFNSAIAQVTIVVGDVNDETPRITVGTGRIEIKENLDHETEIVSAAERYLIATDDDKDADLEFTIDWAATYATKTGVIKTEEEFKPYLECITIKTVDISNAEDNGKSAAAVLYINEVLLKNTPNYEDFDTLYLSIVATDKDQDPIVAENTASVTVPIYIQDVNDVSPVFVQSTIDSLKRVSENAEEGTSIAIILATDEDSPEIYYYLEAENPAHNALVSITDLGEIYVNGSIDADEPPLYYMVFTVTATDGETEPATDTITIEVLDLNDNSPIFEEPTEDFYVPEESPDDYFITKLLATDIDRDPENNQVTYGFSRTMSSNLRNFFSIDEDQLIVQYSTSDKLDRDNGIPGIENTIIVEATDINFNNPMTSEPHIFLVILTDINNNAPIITTTEFNTRENVKEGDLIGEIQAEDKDEENTPNSRIHFEIINIVAVSGQDPPSDLFVIQNEQPDTGKIDLHAGTNLEGYFGTYNIEIRTYDEGSIPSVQEYMNTIIVEISKYNFYAPEFVGDIVDGSKLYLRMNQQPQFQLFQYNGVEVPDIFASDRQEDKYSIDFNVVDSDVFTTVTWNRAQAQLQLISADYDTSEEYTITIVAQAIDAEPVLTAQMTITIEFVDLSAPPVFTDLSQTISFRENTTDLSEEFYTASFKGILPELDHDLVAFYMIHGENYGEFQIDDNTVNKITVINILDRETTPFYTIEIQTASTSTGVSDPGKDSVLLLTIEVEDINDNPPNFSTKQYFGRIASTFTIGTVILTLEATDLDEEPELTYSIIDYVDTPDFISTDNPFKMNPNGAITNEITVLDNAEGHFLFNVEVSDGEFSDEATVHVYILSEKHKVEFVFRNDIATVSNAQSEILRVLELEFNYTCITDQIVQNTDESGQAIEDETIVAVHFVNYELNEPILKDDIQVYANDIQMFASLQTEFQRYALTLIQFLQTGTSTENMEEALRAWLIGVTVVLGTLCVLLLVAFILKTRSLTRRLNKLSVIRYGSQESVSNRRQAPTTNKHAIEGSNPAYNEDKIKSPENDDTVSIDSGESDLVGVENNPEFDYKYEKQS